MFKPKTKEELAILRANRPKAEAGADKHHFESIHRRRAEDSQVDAVCSRCGLEELDVTPTRKSKTARWRQPGYGTLLPAKPACIKSTSD
jgi:tRNA/tmRNA/rRNA uracil-C5-methylase (TrmA/RlmC/RlmD family)